MALCKKDWDITNSYLFIKGVKFWRAAHFNFKTREQIYVCSEQKKSKCPSTALVRYFKKSSGPPVRANEPSIDGDSEGWVDGGGEAEASMFEEDPRENSQKYDKVSSFIGIDN